MREPERKLTRKEVKAESRRRLVDATIRILREQGPTGLTTGKIAREAGLSQPSFYVHFKHMDDALSAAATEIGDQIRAVLAVERRRLGAERSRETMHAAFRSSLNAFLANPTFTELLLRYRRDSGTPIAECARTVFDAMRLDILNDCRAMGLDETRLPRLELFVDLLVGMFVAVVERFLDGRLSNADRESAVDTLFRATMSVYMALAQAD